MILRNAMSVATKPQQSDVWLASMLCRVARATVYRWLRDGKVEWVELPSGRRRIYVDSLFRDPLHRW